MNCPACHKKDARYPTELVTEVGNGKAYKCHVCGSYVCPRCGQQLVSAPPMVSWDYAGEISRLHKCPCQRMYLVVQEG